MSQIIDATERMNAHWTMPKDSATFTFSSSAMKNLLFALDIYAVVADGDNRVDDINDTVNELKLGFNTYLENK